ncbi:hypothetical protein P885DRAFT_44462 [Corynascus similis CBS 632.67]
MTEALPPHDFQFFPVRDAPVDLPPLTLSHSTTWTYCGPLLTLSDPPALADLPPTFSAWSAHTFSSAGSPIPSLLPRLAPFLRAVQSFLRRHGIHHYWLTVRASKPTSDFDTPRWHTDDDFFDYPPRGDSSGNESRSGASLDRCQWKLCGTLQGPGTLFAAEGARAREVLRRAKERARRAEAARPHVCTVVRCAACGRTSDAVREEAHAGLEGEKVAQTGNSEIAFFRIGAKDGAVHSEPRIDCDRVFVNVVPGTEADLRGLMSRWGMEFPRSWTLGVPVVLDVNDRGATGTSEKTKVPNSAQIESAA